VRDQKELYVPFYIHLLLFLELGSFYLPGVKGKVQPITCHEDKDGGIEAQLYSFF
jgi:hypothetical protein